MSLQRVEKIILDAGKMSFWEFLLYFGTLPAIFGTITFLYSAPNFELFQTLDGRLFVFAVLSVMALIGSLAILTASLLIIRSLLKFRKEITVRHGKFTGYALSTNHKFLKDFSKNLFPNLIGFIKGYNDPKINEAKIGLQSQIDEIKSNLRYKIGILKLKLERSERRRITSDAELVKERELRKLALEELNEERKLRKKYEQLLNDKILTKNNDEDTKPVKKFDKLDFSIK